MEMSSRRKLLLFLAIAFVGSWSVAGAFYAIVGTWEGPAAAAVGMLYMMPPTFGALVVKGMLAKDPVVEHLGLRLRPNRWWFVAWVIPPLVVGLTLGVTSLLPGVEVATTVEGFLDFFREKVPADQIGEFEQQVRESTESGLHPLVRMMLQAMVAGITINALIALAEELGWRGLLHHELRLGFWPKSLTIGAIWGVWHAPIVAMGHNYPEHALVGVPMMIGWCLLTSPIFTYIRERSGSVIAAGILHGTINATAGLPLIVSRGGSDLTNGVTGLAGFVALTVVLLVLWAHDRFVAETRVMVPLPTATLPPAPPPEPEAASTRE